MKQDFPGHLNGGQAGCWRANGYLQIPQEAGNQPPTTVDANLHTNGFNQPTMPGHIIGMGRRCCTVACTASARDFSIGFESSEIFSASAAGLDTSFTGNRWLSKVKVPGSQLVSSA